MMVKRPSRPLGDLHGAGATPGKGIGWIALVTAILYGHAPATAAAELCDLDLTVELTPDVPDPSDPGFLSSLLGNNLAYRLTMLHKPDGSVIEIELTGPGPGYLCRNVIEAISKDGRVQSVQVRKQPA